MRVGVFSICYNEAAFLPYFFRHYRQFADFITVLDNCSTDKSFEICKAESDLTDVLHTNDKSNIEILTNLKNNYWKQFKECDWFFIVDIDELVYHPNMRNFLQFAQESNYTVLQPTAYQMICEEFPISEKQITEVMPYGVRSTKEISEAFFSCPSFDKICVINPSKIVETNYSHGAHAANIWGTVSKLRDPSLKLLHYRLLGLDYFLNKNKLRSKRLIPEFVEKGISVHYLKPEAILSPLFAETLIQRKNVVN